MPYKLDQWLAGYGLWRGRPFEDMNAQEKSQALSELDLSHPYVISGSAYDPESKRLFAAMSSTSYNEQDGVMEDRIIYWRHLPFSNTGGTDQSRHNVISIRSSVDAGDDAEEDEDDDNPTLLPEQIWVGKKPVLNILGGDDPNQPKHRRLVEALKSISYRAKSHLNRKKPLEDLAKILSGGNQESDVLARVSGEDVQLRGLSKKGGFEKSLSPSFLDLVDSEEKLVFSQCSEDMLKTLLGWTLNTLEKDRHHDGNRSVTDTDLQSRQRFTTGVRWERDDKTGRAIARLTLSPVDVPEDMDAPEPFDIARLEFSQDGEDRWTLEEASLMQGRKKTFQNRKAALDLIGFFQAANKYLGEWDYPPYRDLCAKYRLLDYMHEFHIPPSLNKEGGETLLVTINGSSLEKKVDTFGDGIGGGNMILHRGLDEEDELSEVAVVIGFPFTPGGAKSDWDGMNADFIPYWDAIKLFILDHDHFDHSTIEFYAAKGWLKGKTIACTPEVEYIVRQRLTNLRVPKSCYPEFIPLEDGKNLCVRDEQGNARIRVSPCVGGPVHSAQSTSLTCMGCYGDDHYQTSFFFYNDAFDLSPKGWAHAEQGPRVFAGEPGVTPGKVDKDLDVAIHDPTGIRYGGDAPRPDDVKKTWRECMKINQDKAIVVVPFSTNHLEIQSFIEEWARQENLRNYTFVGANAEIRATCMNKHGVNPDLELTQIEIEQDAWPQVFHDIAREYGYYDQGTEDPGSAEGESEDAENTGPQFPKGMRSALQSAYKEIREELEEEGKNPKADTRLFMLSSIIKHGRVTFPDNGHNSHAMYLAIREAQERAARHAGRTSKEGKSYRGNPGELGIFSTAPTGVAEEHFGSLPKFAWFWSLFDVDEIVRSTGYQLDAKDLVFYVTQPGPPGSENSQDALMREVVENRDVTIVCAFKNGFRIFNPKDKLTDYMHHYRSLGWECEYDAANNQIRVHDQPFHLHGHGFRNDFLKLVKGIPARLHEMVHIPDFTTFKMGQDLIRQAGRTTSIEKPDDHVSYKFRENPETGEAGLEVTDYLTQSYWLVRLRRQFGRCYGGIVEMVRAIVMRSKGRNKNDGLDVRTDGDGTYYEHAPEMNWSEWLKPGNGGRSARQRRLNPSTADIGKGNQRPGGRSAFSIKPPQPAA